ncbi:MAG: hypothetical protein WC711_01890 [Candidatus Staskawiczbacteria bacterium]|jgi:hypothetical protein
MDNLNEPIILTVIVVDSKSQPKEGATVSITPSDATLKTNSAGEVQFKLGTAKKYEITASVDFAKVTVPYYVTKDGATRLMVNPVYVKSVEAQLHPWWRSTGFITTVSVGLGIIIVLVVVWKFFKRKKKRKQKN